MSQGLFELSERLRDGLVDINSFQYERILGRGGFGEVWKAKHIPTGRDCAVKKLFMEQGDEISLEMFVREVNILYECNHLFLLNLFGFNTIPNFIIVTPYISNGSLFDYVSSRSNKNLSPTSKTLIAMGISYGMMKLHEHGIIHRDLKSPNILLDDKLLPYICDFGIARATSQANEHLTKDIGTVNWMAPEQMESHHYDNKVDVYSYGMVLYEMLMQKIPFEGEKATHIAKLVLSDAKRPKLPSNAEEHIVSLITHCWRQDPQNRPKFEGIFYNFVVKKIFWEGTEPSAIDSMINLICTYDPPMFQKIQIAISQYQDLLSKKKKKKSK